VPVLPDDKLSALLKVVPASVSLIVVVRRSSASCSTPAAASLRCWGSKVDDVEFDLDVLDVMGKGRRGARVPFGKWMGLALARYLPPAPDTLAARRACGSAP
jgi:site-specific recombinase XerC